MDNETLTYFEHRFDSLQKRHDEVSKQIFEKLSEIKGDTSKTNGRVNKHDEQLSKLEQLHINCAGKEALKKIVEESKVQETKETKQYQIGSFLLNASAVSAIVIGFLALIGKIKL